VDDRDLEDKIADALKRNESGAVNQF
jgi:hypothetical protein